MFAQVQSRVKVTVEDRRAVLLTAQARKPRQVAEVSHEDFIRRALKERLGWSHREAAPEAVKIAAKQLAAQLVARDRAIADAKAAQEAVDAEVEEAKNRWYKQQDAKAAQEAAVAQGIADNI